MERLNYSGTKKLPDVFSEQDILRIITQPLRDGHYWDDEVNQKEWGEFLRIRDSCLLATIYLLGLRPKEACCLRFEDFNHSFVKIRGTSNKVRKDRLLPIPDMLIKFYKPYFKLSRNRFWKGSKYLFPSIQSEHISPDTLKRIVREKILKPLNLWIKPESGKRARFSCYTLRHSRASHILNRQIEEFGNPDIYSIANILGHSDIRSTTVYLHLDENYNKYLKVLLNYSFTT